MQGEFPFAHQQNAYFPEEVADIPPEELVDADPKEREDEDGGADQEPLHRRCRCNIYTIIVLISIEQMLYLSSSDCYYFPTGHQCQAR